MASLSDSTELLDIEELRSMVHALGPVEALGNCKLGQLKDYCKRFGVKTMGGKLDIIASLADRLNKTKPANAIRACASPLKPQRRVASDAKSDLSASVSAPAVVAGTKRRPHIAPPDVIAVAPIIESKEIAAVEVGDKRSKQAHAAAGADPVGEGVKVLTNKLAAKRGKFDATASFATLALQEKDTVDATAARVLDERVVAKCIRHEEGGPSVAEPKLADVSEESNALLQVLSAFDDDEEQVDALRALKVIQLKEHCRRLALDDGGKRSELVKRLLAHVYTLKASTKISCMVDTGTPAQVDNSTATAVIPETQLGEEAWMQADGEALHALKVSELKLYCKRLGIADSGKKLDLVTRLQEYARNVSAAATAPTAVASEVVTSQAAQVEMPQGDSLAAPAGVAEGVDEQHMALQALTVPKLREQCRRFCLEETGRKADLVDRLVEHSKNYNAPEASPMTKASPTNQAVVPQSDIVVEPVMGTFAQEELETDRPLTLKERLDRRKRLGLTRPAEVVQIARPSADQQPSLDGLCSFLCQQMDERCAQDAFNMRQLITPGPELLEELREQSQQSVELAECSQNEELPEEAKFVPKRTAESRLEESTEHSESGDEQTIASDAGKELFTVSEATSKRIDSTTPVEASTEYQEHKSHKDEDSFLNIDLIENSDCVVGRLGERELSDFSLECESTSEVACEAPVEERIARDERAVDLNPVDELVAAETLDSDATFFEGLHAIDESVKDNFVVCETIADESGSQQFLDHNLVRVDLLGLQESEAVEQCPEQAKKLGDNSHLHDEPNQALLYPCENVVDAWSCALTKQTISSESSDEDIEEERNIDSMGKTSNQKGTEDLFVREFMLTTGRPTTLDKELPEPGPLSSPTYCSSRLDWKIHELIDQRVENHPSFPTEAVESLEGSEECGKAEQLIDAPSDDLSDLLSARESVNETVAIASARVGRVLVDDAIEDKYFTPESNGMQGDSLAEGNESMTATACSEARELGKVCDQLLEGSFSEAKVVEYREEGNEKNSQDHLSDAQMEDVSLVMSLPSPAVPENIIDIAGNTVADQIQSEYADDSGEANVEESVNLESEPIADEKQPTPSEMCEGSRNVGLLIASPTKIDAEPKKAQSVVVDAIADEEPSSIRESPEESDSRGAGQKIIEGRIEHALFFEKVPFQVEIFREHGAEISHNPGACREVGTDCIEVAATSLEVQEDFTAEVIFTKCSENGDEALNPGDLVQKPLTILAEILSDGLGQHTACKALQGVIDEYPITAQREKAIEDQEVVETIKDCSFVQHRVKEVLNGDPFGSAEGHRVVLDAEDIEKAGPTAGLEKIFEGSKDSETDIEDSIGEASGADISNPADITKEALEDDVPPRESHAQNEEWSAPTDEAIESRLRSAEANETQAFVLELEVSECLFVPVAGIDGHMEAEEVIDELNEDTSLVRHLVEPVEIVAASCEQDVCVQEFGTTEEPPVTPATAHTNPQVEAKEFDMPSDEHSSSNIVIDLPSENDTVAERLLPPVEVPKSDDDPAKQFNLDMGAPELQGLGCERFLDDPWCAETNVKKSFVCTEIAYESQKDIEQPATAESLPQPWQQLGQTVEEGNEGDVSNRVSVKSALECLADECTEKDKVEVYLSKSPDPLNICLVAELLPQHAELEENLQEHNQPPCSVPHEQITSVSNRCSAPIVLLHTVNRCSEQAHEEKVLLPGAAIMTEDRCEEAARAQQLLESGESSSVDHFNVGSDGVAEEIVFNKQTRSVLEVTTPCALAKGGSAKQVCSAEVRFATTEGPNEETKIDALPDQVQELVGETLADESLESEEVLLTEHASLDEQGGEIAPQSPLDSAENCQVLEDEDSGENVVGMEGFGRVETSGEGNGQQLPVLTDINVHHSEMETSLSIGQGCPALVTESVVIEEYPITAQREEDVEDEQVVVDCIKDISFVRHRVEEARDDDPFGSADGHPVVLDAEGIEKDGPKVGLEKIVESSEDPEADIDDSIADASAAPVLTPQDITEEALEDEVPLPEHRSQDEESTVPIDKAIEAILHSAEANGAQKFVLELEVSECLFVPAADIEGDMEAEEVTDEFVEDTSFVRHLVEPVEVVFEGGVNVQQFQTREEPPVTTQPPSNPQVEADEFDKRGEEHSLSNDVMDLPRENDFEAELSLAQVEVPQTDGNQAKQLNLDMGPPELNELGCERFLDEPWCVEPNVKGSFECLESAHEHQKITEEPATAVSLSQPWQQPTQTVEEVYEGDLPSHVPPKSSLECPMLADECIEKSDVEADLIKSPDPLTICLVAELLPQHAEMDEKLQEQNQPPCSVRSEKTARENNCDTEPTELLHTVKRCSEHAHEETVLLSEAAIMTEDRCDVAATGQQVLESGETSNGDEVQADFIVGIERPAEEIIVNEQTKSHLEMTTPCELAKGGSTKPLRGAEQRFATTDGPNEEINPDALPDQVQEQVSEPHADERFESEDILLVEHALLVEQGGEVVAQSLLDSVENCRVLEAEDCGKNIVGMERFGIMETTSGHGNGQELPALREITLHHSVIGKPLSMAQGCPALVAKSDDESNFSAEKNEAPKSFEESEVNDCQCSVAETIARKVEEVLMIREPVEYTSSAQSLLTLGDCMGAEVPLQSVEECLDPGKGAKSRRGEVNQETHGVTVDAPLVEMAHDLGRNLYAEETEERINQPSQDDSHKTDPVGNPDLVDYCDPNEEALSASASADPNVRGVWEEEAIYGIVEDRLEDEVVTVKPLVAEMKTSALIHSPIEEKKLQVEVKEMQHLVAGVVSVHENVFGASLEPSASAAKNSEAITGNFPTPEDVQIVMAEQPYCEQYVDPLAAKRPREDISKGHLEDALSYRYNALKRPKAERDEVNEVLAEIEIRVGLEQGSLPMHEKSMREVSTRLKSDREACAEAKADFTKHREQVFEIESIVQPADSEELARRPSSEEDLGHLEESVGEKSIGEVLLELKGAVDEVTSDIMDASRVVKECLEPSQLHIEATERSSSTESECEESNTMNELLIGEPLWAHSAHCVEDPEAQAVQRGSVESLELDGAPDVFQASVEIIGAITCSNRYAKPIEEIRVIRELGAGEICNASPADAQVQELFQVIQKNNLSSKGYIVDKDFEEVPEDLEKEDLVDAMGRTTSGRLTEDFLVEERIPKTVGRTTFDKDELQHEQVSDVSRFCYEQIIDGKQPIAEVIERESQSYEIPGSAQKNFDVEPTEVQPPVGELIDDRKSCGLFGNPVTADEHVDSVKMIDEPVHHAILFEVVPPPAETFSGCSKEEMSLRRARVAHGHEGIVNIKLAAEPTEAQADSISGVDELIQRETVALRFPICAAVLNEGLEEPTVVEASHGSIEEFPTDDCGIMQEKNPHGVIIDSSAQGEVNLEEAQVVHETMQDSSRVHQLSTLLEMIEHRYEDLAPARDSLGSTDERPRVVDDESIRQDGLTGGFESIVICSEGQDAGKAVIDKSIEDGSAAMLSKLAQVMELTLVEDLSQREFHVKDEKSKVRVEESIDADHLDAEANQDHTSSVELDFSERLFVPARVSEGRGEDVDVIDEVVEKESLAHHVLVGLVEITAKCGEEAGGVQEFLQISEKQKPQATLPIIHTNAEVDADEFENHREDHCANEDVDDAPMGSDMGVKQLLAAEETFGMREDAAKLLILDKEQQYPAMGGACSVPVEELTGRLEHNIEHTELPRSANQSLEETHKEKAPLPEPARITGNEVQDDFVVGMEAVAEEVVVDELIQDSWAARTPAELAKEGSAEMLSIAEGSFSTLDGHLEEDIQAQELVASIPADEHSKSDAGFTERLELNEERILELQTIIGTIKHTPPIEGGGGVSPVDLFEGSAVHERSDEEIGGMEGLGEVETRETENRMQLLVSAEITSDCSEMDKPLSSVDACPVIAADLVDEKNLNAEGSERQDSFEGDFVLPETIQIVNDEHTYSQECIDPPPAKRSLEDTSKANLHQELFDGCKEFKRLKTHCCEVSEVKAETSARFGLEEMPPDMREQIVSLSCEVREVSDRLNSDREACDDANAESRDTLDQVQESGFVLEPHDPEGVGRRPSLDEIPEQVNEAGSERGLAEASDDLQDTVDEIAVDGVMYARERTREECTEPDHQQVAATEHSSSVKEDIDASEISTEPIMGESSRVKLSDPADVVELPTEEAPALHQASAFTHSNCSQERIEAMMAVHEVVATETIHPLLAGVQLHTSEVDIVDNDFAEAPVEVHEDKVCENSRVPGEVYAQQSPDAQVEKRKVAETDGPGLSPASKRARAGQHEGDDTGEERLAEVGKLDSRQAHAEPLSDSSLEGFGVVTDTEEKVERKDVVPAGHSSQRSSHPASARRPQTWAFPKRAQAKDHQDNENEDMSHSVVDSEAKEMASKRPLPSLMSAPCALEESSILDCLHAAKRARMALPAMQPADEVYEASVTPTNAGGADEASTLCS